MKVEELDAIYEKWTSAYTEAAKAGVETSSHMGTLANLVPNLLIVLVAVVFGMSVVLGLGVREMKQANSTQRDQLNTITALLENRPTSDRGMQLLEEIANNTGRPIGQQEPRP